MLKTILKIAGAVVGMILLVLVVYVVYLLISYDRIEDNQKLDITKSDAKVEELKAGTDEIFTVGTYNVGFGAYLPDYSFFMDGGKYSRCYSAESATDAISGAAEFVKKYNPQFMLFQEVDLDATRSRHVNEDALIAKVFEGYSETFAVNYDSAYLFYPFHEPIGKSKSGIATFSAYDITSALRRSLPISTSFSKFVDLDRCYSINRIPVKVGEEEKELIIFNVHLSAYGNSDEIREGQLSMLFTDMAKERDKGNYVICGGDFNHDLLADEADAENCKSWAYPFPRSKMPEGFSFGIDFLSEKEIASMPKTSRNADMEYVPGKTQENTLDGFIISDNVDMLGYEVADTEFAYSDHQPVMMKFKLK